MNRVHPLVRWLAGSTVAVALLTLAFVVKGNGQPVPLPSTVTASPSSSAVPVKPSTDRLFIQLSDQRNRVEANVLVVRTASGLQVVTLNSKVAFDFGQVGIQTIESAGQITSMATMAQVIQDGTGLTIGPVLQMQRLALAGLIDAVGGVQVNSASLIDVAADPTNPEWVAAGVNQLQGGVAADYALYQGKRETAVAKSSRTVEVLKAALAKLPRDLVRCSDLLSALGGTARTSVPTDDVAAFLTDLNAHAMWPKTTHVDIPTRRSDLQRQASSTWLRVDPADATKIAIATAPSKPAKKSDSRIVVVAGGDATTRLRIRDKLRAKGYTFVDGGFAKVASVTTITLDSTLTTFSTRTFAIAVGADTLTVKVLQNADIYGDVRISVGADLVKK